jgi:cytochrome c553
MKHIGKAWLAMALIALVSVVSACEPEGNDKEDGANHNVGNDCLVCHKAGGGGKGIFSAGGSVFKTGTNTGAAGVTVSLFATFAGTGTPVATMTTGPGGNFYTSAAIDFGTGLYAKITSATGTLVMNTPVTTGACSSCHGQGSVGRITVK